MRKYLILNEPIGDVKKIMVHQVKDGVYVFLYNTTEDKACYSDLWFDTLTEAESFTNEEYGCDVAWNFIDDPLENCQQDFIRPIRVKDRNIGTPQWGIYEQLIDGRWIELMNS